MRRTLGPYQLLRKVGRGGMAEVWSARRSAAGADKFVAIKLLAPHLAEQKQYRDMFLAEARLSMMLNHSNIVHVFDAVDAEPDCYMVMELVEGMTLSQLERALGKQGLKIPLDVTTFVIGELLRALAYAHSVSLDAGSIIVHRDVSPQNVMVTTAGEVKLMDFGIARFATEETQGNFVKGKLQYMPPEQLRKETRKPTIDLFAVGGILHELIDGRRFRGNIDQVRLIGMVIQGEIPDLQTTEPLPPAIDQLRLGLLQAEEEHRIQSAKDALMLLQDWPGYHHAAFQLEELVQRFVVPSSATNSATDFVVLEDSAVAPSPRDPGDPGHDSGVRGTVRELTSDSAIRQLDPRAAAETIQSSVDATDASLELISSIEHRPGSAVPVVRPAAPKRWVWAAVSLLVLGAVGGTAMVVASQVDDRNTSVAAAEETPPAPEPEPKPETPPEPETPPIPEPIPEPETPPEQPPIPLPIPIVEPEPILEDPLAPDEARVLVTVEFVANEFFFVYVKVNGKKLTLEPKSRIKLPVGSFNVYLRTDMEAEWIKAGRIVLEAGHDYRVEMLEPAGLNLVEVSA